MESSLPSKSDSPIFISLSEEETLEYGRQLAALLHRGSIVALRGGLGAGKTYFTKGIALGLGISETITSPTYTIVSEYRGWLGGKTAGGQEGQAGGEAVPLYHIDAYRLAGDEDFAALGGEEMLYGEGITVIEWSERLRGSIPKEAITVEIEVLDGGKRGIKVEGTT
jgi:tRNA threonylcarbamoyladenosine biosynthesis protein TsaE